MEFGEHRVARFLKRHKELKGKIGKGISRQRATASHPEVVSNFLDSVHKIVIGDKIPLCNM